MLLIGGGASHDYQRWFNLADVALLNGTGRITAGYLEPQDVTADLVRTADVLLISANKAFPDPEVRKAIFAHVEGGKGRAAAPRSLVQLARLGRVQQGSGRRRFARARPARGVRSDRGRRGRIIRC